MYRGGLIIPNSGKDFPTRKHIEEFEDVSDTLSGTEVSQQSSTRPIQ